VGKRHLAALYRDFKPERFDDIDFYTEQSAAKYNKENVKNLYQERKQIMLINFHLH
jgi:hypothetical protein